jgi:pyrroline-5-carboxylate reductase
MKTITIIGAGNMGGAIAAALSSSPQVKVTVTNRSKSKLEKLQTQYPSLAISTDNIEAVKGADLVILAVKPWIMSEVITQIKDTLNYNQQAIVSIAGGMGLDTLDELLDKQGAKPAIFHVIPDTAISVGHGMTFIAARRASDELKQFVKEIFSSMGEAAIVEERLMNAATALSSCGIAYAYKYVQACVQAGVQLGFRPDDALHYVLATVDGAVAMLRQNETLPQQEIDRVTTPGGMTIKGINELDHQGFTSAVIRAILKPLE